MSSEAYHEPLELLSETTRNFHRAIVSLVEELEAIDWYQQRAEASPDADLKAILTHNQNEETEHAMMVLEWIRRHHPYFDTVMRKYLFSSAPITEIEEKLDAEPPARAGADGSAATSLGIGSLKGR